MCFRIPPLFKLHLVWYNTGRFYGKRRLENMEQQKIDRINALAKKAKTTGLSEAEAAEQKMLREEYIAAFRSNLKAQLDHTVILKPDGTAAPLRQKRGKL